MYVYIYKYIQIYPCFFSGNMERRKTTRKRKINISKNENYMTFYKEHYVLAQVKFFKIGLHKNFANFIGKHLCWSLFLIKFYAFRPSNLFFIEHLR